MRLVLTRASSISHTITMINQRHYPSPKSVAERSTSCSTTSAFTSSSTPGMPRELSQTSSVSTATQRPVRTNRMTPGFHEKTRAAIKKHIQNDYTSLSSFRNQELKNKAWRDWSEDQRNDRMQSIAREWLIKRKAQDTSAANMNSLRTMFLKFLFL